jgi:hypothetical protein
VDDDGGGGGGEGDEGILELVRMTKGEGKMEGGGGGGGGGGKEASYEESQTAGESMATGHTCISQRRILSGSYRRTFTITSPTNDDVPHRSYADRRR